MITTLPFTKQDVLTAFENLKPLGIKPIKQEFVQTDMNNKVCGVCAITAVILDRKLKTEDEIDSIHEYGPIIGIEDKKLIWAFTSGFDGAPGSYIYQDEESHYTQAFKLGVEIAAEVFNS